MPSTPKSQSLKNLQQHSHYLAGDWGTSSFRLYLCDAHTGCILNEKHGRGIKDLATQGNAIQDEYNNLSLEWRQLYGKLPCILSGMVGSNIGWQETPYVNAPCQLDQLAAHCQQIVGQPEVLIVPGLRCTNPIGTPDVMRGEELQLLGWLQLSEIDQQSNIVCLPGTHNKWVRINKRLVESFSTAFTGELFSLLQQHSLLKSDSDDFDKESFLTGVELSQSASGIDSLHTLFTTRSLQLAGKLHSEQASSYLSGLLIGADILGAKSLYTLEGKLIIIGSEQLSTKYKIAAAALGIDCELFEPKAVAEAAYWHLYKAINEVN